ncbi:hypothetical protein [Cohnella kolymensis]|nr:hypothetical protein [Cohnella kolymensis]
MYIWLMLQFFTARSYQINPLLVLGIRYGLLASMLGFASGLWMAVVQSRYFGEHGNILDVHFLGFHGLQAAPVLALLLGKCTAAVVRRHRLLHAAGLLWFALAAYAFVPTYLGRSLFTWSDPWVLPVYVLLAVWAAVAIGVLVMFMRRRTALPEKTSLAATAS